MSGFGHDTATTRLTVTLENGGTVKIVGADDGVNGITWSAEYVSPAKLNRFPVKIKVDHEVLIDGITPADDDDLPPYPFTRCHEDCNHPNLDHAADDEPCENGEGQPLTLRPSETPTVECKFCGEQVPAATAHMHQGSYVGDDCCWDERLRSTE